MQAMKAQAMYDKPVNSIVHTDSAGHVDIENFGALNACAESLFISPILFIFFYFPYVHFHFHFLLLHFPSFSRGKTSLPCDLQVCVLCNARNLCRGTVLGSSAAAIEKHTHVLTCTRSRWQA
jgi:hypothetical protein